MMHKEDDAFTHIAHMSDYDPATNISEAGYFALFFPALVPALWRAIMDSLALKNRSCIER